MIRFPLFFVVVVGLALGVDLASGLAQEGDFPPPPPQVDPPPPPPSDPPPPTDPSPPPTVTPPPAVDVPPTPEVPTTPITTGSVPGSAFELSTSILNFDPELLEDTARFARRPIGPAVLPDKSDVWRDEIVVEFETGFDGTADIAGSSLDETYDLDLLDQFTSNLLGRVFKLFRIPRNRSMPALLFALAADPRVRSVQQNYAYDLAAGPVQYALDKIGIQQAHFPAAGKNVRIALIDTAVDVSHKDLASARIIQLSAFEDEVGQPLSHGTAIASILVGKGNVKGVVPAAEIIAIEAFRASRKDRYKGRSSSFYVVRALDLAASKKPHIVNMSLTGPKDSLLYQTIALLHARGILVVAAAGNGGPRAKPAYPAAYGQVFAVTATDSSDRLYKDANHGNYIFLSAPGVNILTASHNKGYALNSGTSMAAAHVTGALAFLLDRNPELGDFSSVEQLLRSTSVDLGDPGRDPVFGVGRLDVSSLLQ